jgi:hypothetical protein
MTRPDLVLEVLVCAVDPASRTIDCREAMVKVCEVVAHVGECGERLREIKLTLPANLGLASFPECWRPAKGCGPR